jgi:hypothetical protein
VRPCCAHGLHVVFANRVAFRAYLSSICQLSQYPLSSYVLLVCFLFANGDNASRLLLNLEQLQSACKWLQRSRARIKCYKYGRHARNC